jgi:hypothetical protein
LTDPNENGNLLKYGRFRLLYESYLTGKRICGLSMAAEAFYWRIYVGVADDFGNFPADPFILVPKAAGLRKVGDEDCYDWVKEMEQVGLVRLYLVDETDWYGHILSFVKMQPPSRAPRGPSLGRMRRYPESPWDNDIPLSNQPRRTTSPLVSSAASRGAQSNISYSQISEIQTSDLRSHLKIHEKESDRDVRGLDRKDFVLRSFQYWQQELTHPQAVLSPERIRLLQARWKDSTFDEMTLAFDGCKSSDFHMGRQPNNPDKFDDITLICRTRAKLEFFMDKVRNRVKPREDKDKKREEARKRWETGS